MRIQSAFDALGVELTSDMCEVAAGSALDALWPKLLADARDRIATLIEAADAYLHATEKGGAKRPASDIAVKRRQLKRAMAMLEDEK